MALKKHLLFFLTALFILVLDQLAKRFITVYSISRDYSFVRIHFVKNFGIGFGILNLPFLRWVMVGIISLIVIGLAYYYSRTGFKSSAVFVFSLALVLGGALGNLVDRIMYGFVVDFIDFSFWPAFNIADSAISVGIILLILISWIFPKIPTKSSVKKSKPRINPLKNRKV